MLRRCDAQFSKLRDFGVPDPARSVRISKPSAFVYAGAGPNVCHTALDSAEQNSVTAYATGRFSATPCKGGVRNIRACTCVLSVTAGSMQWSKAESSKNLIYWKILSYRTK